MVRTKAISIHPLTQLPDDLSEVIDILFDEASSLLHARRLGRRTFLGLRLFHA